ncbi:MAG: PD-(D/E)XK nuclease family protein [Verrucomicrobia bacterium]|nr:MAG: PD-(D/E)XK nuclease family protein [Verrucomicrobiota bacterium]
MTGRRSESVLVVHPTSLALRQLQRRTLTHVGFFDARGHITFAGLLNSCAEAARQAGLLAGRRSASDLDYEMLLLETAQQFRAKSAAQQGPLAALAQQALEDTLDQLIAFLAPLADRIADALAILARGTPKNRALATLYQEFQAAANAMDVSTEADENAAILRLLRGDCTAWPAVLHEATAVRFVAVRAITPMLESVSHALVGKPGGTQVQIEHILEEHEQEWWGEKFLAGSCRLLFGTESAAEDAACHAAQTWSVVTSLREAYAMRDPGLAAEARTNVGFSCSAGLYGEVEDLARRICWELEQPDAHLRPEEIALVVPNVGQYADAIADVFQRFQLPYHFRRGNAVLAAPVTQAILRLLEVRATRSRDAFCALLESPWLKWERIQETEYRSQKPEVTEQLSAIRYPPSALADSIRRAGIEPEMPEAAVLALRVRNFLLAKRPPATDAQAIGDFAAQVFRLLYDKNSERRPLTKLCNQLISELRQTFGVEGQVRQFLQNSFASDDLTRQAALFNSRALTAVIAQLETLGKHKAETTMTWAELLALLRRVLRNVTVAAGSADESGVWVLNPHDAAGLHFRVTLIAGLNAGRFPALPAPSPVFSDAELRQLREALTALPQTALAPSVARRSQDNLLFLTTLATASERLVFSYQSRDETGEELQPSICFATAWRLAGWPSWEKLPSQPPDPYDRWRLKVAPEIFREFWEAARNGKDLPIWQRKPFHGESFLATRPLALCRAADEARQQAARSLAECRSPAPAGRPADAVSELVARSLTMEAERTRIFTQQALQPNQPPEHGTRFVGSITAQTWQQVRPKPRTIPDFSATELETLATCPYKYYLQRVLHLEALKTNEQEATPLALGSLVHRVMHHALLLLRGDPPPPDAPAVLADIRHGFADLCRPAFAVQTTDHPWRIMVKGPGRPVVQFQPDKTEHYAEFMAAVANAELEAEEQALASMMLGAIEQRGVVRTNLIAGCNNLLRLSLQPAEFDKSMLPPLRRYPALLEFAFGSGQGCEKSAVTFVHPDDPVSRLRVHGKLDRVDLLADDDGVIRAMTVVDYKGVSKSGLQAEELAAEIIAARNCQLPVYGLVAQATFGDDLPLLLQYLPYRGDFSEILKQTPKRWIALTGEPVDSTTLAELIGTPQTPLMAAFARRIFQCLEILEHGDFRAAPQACEHCEFRGCCRYTAPALEGETEEGA